MYHSITIGEKNTWDDWHLIPSTRPVFKQPTQKIKTVDIPGANGILDLSQSLTKYPLYNNREGSLEFNVVNGYEPWNVLCLKIANYLSGRTYKAILEDDKEYYYEGTFALNEWKSEKNWSKVVIDYKLNPFKWSYTSTLEDWHWDPFNFYNGLIVSGDFSGISLTRESDTPVPHRFTAEQLGRAAVCPKFTFDISSPVPHPGQEPLDDGMVQVTLIDRVRGINKTVTTIVGSSGGSASKTVQFPEIVFAGNDVTMYFTCRDHTTGDVAIDFRAGWL